MIFIGFGGNRMSQKTLLSHGGSVPKAPLNPQPKTNLLFRQYGIDPKKHQGAFNAIESIFREWQEMERTGNYGKWNSLNRQLTKIFQGVLDKEPR